MRAPGRAAEPHAALLDGARKEERSTDLLRRLSIPELLAALAGLTAAVASLAGFVPGLYRDPRVVVAQSHGYDAGNLLVVVVLALGLRASAGGSVRGRLVAIGALGCLLYGYVTYAFLIVLNPVTLLHIAVLGCGGWAFATGLASVDPGGLETTVGPNVLRRTSGPSCCSWLPCSPAPGSARSSAR